MTVTRSDGPAVDFEDKVLLTVPETARALGIGTTLAYELVARGVLPHIRLGRALRVPRAALEAWIAANTLGAPARPRTLRS